MSIHCKKTSVSRQGIPSARAVVAGQNYQSGGKINLFPSVWMFVPAPTDGFFNSVTLQSYMTYALGGSSVSYHGSHAGGDIFLEICHWIFCVYMKIVTVD